MSKICDFEGSLKTECNLQHLTRNFGIKNLDDFERDETDAYLWKAGLLNVKENRMTIYYIINRCLVDVFERRESKCCAISIKYFCKVKGQQVIILQMDQQLKTKNISDVSGKLFCCQCKDKFLLETD